jgi:hypothetical protein
MSFRYSYLHYGKFIWHLEIVYVYIRLLYLFVLSVIRNPHLMYYDCYYIYHRCSPSAVWRPIGRTPVLYTLTLLYGEEDLFIKEQIAD